ncbi:HDOD domain-containing protein [Ideonella sp. B508-1]|uniref:HDOD domain-containing protein n=1 Tax=Ideonella sp. B508-1 TaxID=137716 RepID=UPI0011D22AC8|nr:HDOD domain-containing protein [Ideonella sp. B508-1]
MSTALLVGLPALLVLAMAVAWRRRVPAPQVPATPDPAAAPPLTTNRVEEQSPSGQDPWPQALADFRLIHADELPDERRVAVTAVFRNIPRPSRLMQHLAAVDLLNEASAARLVELIAAEPVIAGKLLSAVNSPLYGLQTPVASVAQAVTFLGLTQVRAICLRYALMQSFAQEAPERQAMLDRVWQGSALACELAQVMTHTLSIRDPGAVGSAVLLSFLGRLAVTATTPTRLLTAADQPDHLGRTRAEQALLGVGANEVGRLLMRDWALPEPIIASACDPADWLVRPVASSDSGHAETLALTYLCARLGERLASGALPSLQNFDLAGEDSADFFHLRHGLPSAGLGRWAAALRAPELSARLERLQANSFRGY